MDFILSGFAGENKVRMINNPGGNLNIHEDQYKHNPPFLPDKERKEMFGNTYITIVRGLIILFILIALSGCGHNEDSLLDANTKEEVYTEFLDTEETASVEYSDIIVQSESTPMPEPLRIPVSTERKDILYHGTDGIDISLSMHRCESDGENIYLVYGDAGELDLYNMPIGSDEHSRINIDNPEEMVICHIAIDIYGNKHLIVAGNNYEEWFIWRLNESNQIEKVIDISDYFEIRQMPHWFLVDKDGTYYLQWVISRDGVIIDREGALKHKFTLKSLETRWTYEVAVGKDGLIYIVYYDADEKLRIGEFDTENGSIKKENTSLCFADDETFSEMSAGTDTNLLLFSPYSGVWAYDYEKEVLENRVSLSDLGLTKDANYVPLTFLPDGRLLLLEKSGKDTRLKYIPAGK